MLDRLARVSQAHPIRIIILALVVGAAALGLTGMMAHPTADIGQRVGLTNDGQSLIKAFCGSEISTQNYRINKKGEQMFTFFAPNLP